MTEEKIIFVGPFLGNFKEEICTFRPYARFIWESLECTKFIISSHYNRGFLYDWTDEFIPIEKSLTEDELNQKGYIHKEVNQRDYTKKVKKIKEKICENENCAKRNIIHYNLPYVKTSPPISIYQKSFVPIDWEEDRLEEADILFIPDIKEFKEKISSLYKKISNDFKVIVAGDKKGRLEEKNNLNNLQYIDEVYKYIIEYMSKCEVVVTPCSHWTFLANLQGVPVFSWGKFISPYKKDGEYSMNNKNMIVPNLDIDKLYDQLISFYYHIQGS